MLKPEKTLNNPLPVYFLKPGDLFASAHPHKVKTLLGTCVSIILYDKALKIGGINHFMLPDGKHDDVLPGKYAVKAFDLLLEKMQSLGSRKHSIKAKIFGGADNTTGFARSSIIGQRNVEAAIDLLNNAEIKIVAQNTGGNLGRKIFFYTGSGDVYLKFLTPNNELL